LGEIENTENHLSAISGIPGIFSWSDGAIPRNLASVLKAGMERVRADHGFIAMEWAGVVEQPVRIVARAEMSENLAEQLARWYRGRQAVVDPTASVLFSRLDQRDALVEAVPALQGKARSCLFMPIAMHGKRFGFLYLGKENISGRDGGFGRPALDFLATYMGFLALFLFEKGRGRLPGEAWRAPTPIEGAASFENIITEHEAMLEVLALARRVAPSDLTVLLCGETGTGKGLLAYTIHALSRRAEKKFLSINCAAIPETLLESELFGHVKGSFTGATSDKRGLLAEAEGGTVFLDEIGKMPLSMQAKLLQFLDTKVIRPVGSNQERRVDVRIVCASKNHLNELAQSGTFLEDLYYRLLDFPLTIPPLRERRDDIPLLVHHFIERFAQDASQPPPGYTAPFMEALTQHEWPGNVRELEKCIRRAIVLANDDRVLKPEHLPAEIALYALRADRGGLVAPLRESLASVECREIRQALKLTRGNKSEASRLLGISYPNLLKKIRFYGIQTG
jgi:DNA-binding NtrC family response regulator